MAPRKLKVLFGFNQQLAENNISVLIRSYGYQIQGTARYSKTMIKDYLKKNPDTDVVFLKEFLDGGERYGAMEISDLADECNANFVVVMRSSNRGHEAMKILYCAGIVNAVFADGKAGVNPEELARLAVKSRTHKEARQFYKIDAPMPDYGVLNYEDFRDNYSYLIDNESIPGSEMIDRFIDISRFLSPRQLGKFICELPEEDLEILCEYDEFYKITDKLRQQACLSKHFRKPRQLYRAVNQDSPYIVVENKRNRRKEEEPVLEGAATYSDEYADDYEQRYEEEYTENDDYYNDDSDDLVEEEEQRPRRMRQDRRGERQSRAEERKAQKAAKKAEKEELERQRREERRERRLAREQKVKKEAPRKKPAKPVKEVRVSRAEEKRKTNTEQRLNTVSHRKSQRPYEEEPYEDEVQLSMEPVEEYDETEAYDEPETYYEMEQNKVLYTDDIDEPEYADEEEYEDEETKSYEPQSASEEADSIKGESKTLTDMSIDDLISMYQ